MTAVYFGCSMRGGFPETSQEDLRRVQSIVEELGHTLVGKQQTNATFRTDEASLSNQQIHDAAYEFLMKAQVGIFEISNPSLGVGGEISDMINLKKPVLCLYQRRLETSVSSYIQGKQGSKYVPGIFRCQSYESFPEAKERIKGFLDFCLPTIKG